MIEKKLTEIIYEGLWFSPLTTALKAFLKETQKYVTGTVRVKLIQRSCDRRRKKIRVLFIR